MPIRNISVTADRSMKEIGLQHSRLDTTVLHENVALSLADVLTFNSSIFVKQYGRATLSTATFRGTSPSHTQVTWNGLGINSPMLGMTDFSMIPSYFIDDAVLLRGPSSAMETGGGLGGAVKLATKPAETRGLALQYVQGVGSFHTFDEFLRLGWGNDRWQVSTRAVHSSSRNDFRYRNYNKKMNVYDDDHNIIDTYYPVERNKNGAFRDFHILQEAWYSTKSGDRFGLQAWWLDSRRGLPMLSVDHRPENEYINEQSERTLRSVLSWERLRDTYKTSVRAGYVHSRQGYYHAQDRGNGELAEIERSRSRLNTVYASAGGEYYLGRKWLFAADISLRGHFVNSGYNHRRMELSGSVSAKWMPVERTGLSIVLREDMQGGVWSPPIPMFFADYVISRHGNVVAKASVSRNYRFPTLNDLYFEPGGNPDLRQEHGFTYDAGVSFAVGRDGVWSLKGDATWFDSYIDDWIIWLPTARGYWTPLNIRNVHSYGVELRGDLDVQLARNWQLGMDGFFSWTSSINNGDPTDWADEAVGKQLMYVPLYSAAVTGHLSYRSWRLIYKWCWYSERFTTSNNDRRSRISRVLPYFMSDVSLEKRFSFSWSDFSVKLAVKNLFNEEYESVLSRPMPRMNFEVFLDIRPKWGNGGRKGNKGE